MHGGPVVSLERQLAAAAAAGFDWYAADIWSFRASRASGRSLHDVRAVADSCALDLGQLQTLLLPTPEPFDRWIADLADITRVLQPATMQVIVTGDPAVAREQFRTASHQLRAIAPDLVFALEYTSVQEIHDMAGALRFARSTGVEGFGLCLDAWIFFEAQEPWAALEALDVDDIAHVQFADHDALAEGHDFLDEIMNRKVLPGDGCFDLTRFFATIRDLGYAGRAGVEVSSERLRAASPEEFARVAHSAGCRFWGQRREDAPSAG
jgi:sugar phosphate isomerase/epimerase